MREIPPAGRAAGLAAALATAVLLAGCGETARDGRTVETAGPDVHLSGYPFRPAPFYNLDHLDELSGSQGYTAGY